MSVSQAHEVMWSPWDQPGLERFRLLTDSTEHLFQGDLISTLEKKSAYLIQYAIRCTPDWRIQNVILNINGENKLDWWMDSDGRWSSRRDDENLSQFEGCQYIDLTVTPSTNTLATSYMRIASGETKTIDVLYLDFDTLPALTLSRARQRYTHLGQRGNETHYRFEHLDNGFMAELPFDSSNLVIDYPDLFRRVWQREV